MVEFIVIASSTKMEMCLSQVRPGRYRSRFCIRRPTMQIDHSRSVDAIDQDVGVKDSCIPFECFTETFRNPDRRTVFRMDKTNDVRLVEFIEPIFKRPSR